MIMLSRVCACSFYQSGRASLGRNLRFLGYSSLLPQQNIISDNLTTTVAKQHFSSGSVEVKKKLSKRKIAKIKKFQEKEERRFSIKLLEQDGIQKNIIKAENFEGSIELEVERMVTVGHGLEILALEQQTIDSIIQELQGPVKSLGRLCALLNTLAKKGEPKIALKFLKNIDTKGLQKTSSSERTICAVKIHLHALNNDPVAAEASLNEMSLAGHKPSENEIFMVVKSHIRIKDLEAAFKSFTLFEKFEVQPTVISYSMLIKGCTELSDFKLTFGTYADMRAAAIKPDAACYALLFKACAKFRESERALVMYDEIKNEVDFSIHMYGSLIDALSTNSKFQEKIFMILCEMHDKGLKPNTLIVDSVLKSCAKTGNVRAAHLAFNNLEGVADTRLYNNLISCYAGRVKQIVDEIFNRRLRGQVLILTLKELQTQVYIDSGSIEAPSFFDAKPNWSVSELIDISGRRFAQLEAQGLNPNVHSLNSFLRVYANALQFDTALELFENMPERYGVQRDAHSYRIMIELCKKLTQPAKAIELYRKMEKEIEDWEKDNNAVSIYTDLIYSATDAHAFKFAVVLVEKMTKNLKEFPPPHVFLHIRSCMLQEDGVTEWDKIKELCLKYDVTGRWRIFNEKHQENIRKLRPKRVHHMMARQYLPNRNRFLKHPEYSKFTN